jgi:hypothetical protein
MKRVGYLAALGGGAGPVAAPSLRPPRRLFPHEPVAGDAPRLPAGQRTTGAPPPELPAVRARAANVTAPPALAQPEPAAPPAAPPGERAPSAARRLPVPRGRATARDTQERPEPARPTRAGAIEPAGRALPIEVAPPRVPARAGSRASAPPLEPPAGEPAAELSRPAVPWSPRRADAPSSPRRAESDAPAREPRREPVPAAARTRRAPAPLEPLRTRPEPELRQPRTPAPRRSEAVSSRVPQVHIGTIEVIVVPPAPPPALPQQPRAVARAGSTVAPRSGAAGRWFGLAQR